MPHLVSHTVPASQVRAGDLHMIASMLHTVESVESKTKWTTLRFEGQAQSLRFENDHQVDVQREEDTPEEVATKEREYSICMIQHEINAAPAAVAIAKDALLAELDVQDGYHGFRYENYVAGQQHAALWERVAQRAEFMISSGQGDLFDASKTVIEEVKESLLDDTSGASRSTSEMTNTIKDVQRGVKAKWLRNARYIAR